MEGGWSWSTCKDGDDGLMDRGDLLLLKDVACEEGHYKQRDEDGESP